MTKRVAIVWRPCLVCGKPAQSTRCPTHEAERQQVRNASRPQYSGAWRALSRKARRQQPWCTRCGRRDDLTLDHQTGTVECRSCNSSHRRDVGRA